MSLLSWRLLGQVFFQIKKIKLIRSWYLVGRKEGGMFHSVSSKTSLHVIRAIIIYLTVSHSNHPSMIHRQPWICVDFFVVDCLRTTTKQQKEMRRWINSWFISYFNFTPVFKTHFLSLNSNPAADLLLLLLLLLS